MGQNRHLIETELNSKVQRRIVTLVSGEATWTFTTPFPTKPVIGHMFEEDAENQPVIVKVKSWTLLGGQYTSVTVKGYRSRTLPNSLTLIGALNLFNIFGGAAPNVAVHLIAAEATL